MVRLRADLIAQPTKQRGRLYWLLRDPLRRQVLRVSDRDYQRLRADPIDESVDPDLIGLAIQQHLLVGQTGGTLSSAAHKSRWNPLYIRFPGINADRMLQAMVPWTDWLFSARAVALWLAVVTLAVAMVLVYAPDVAAALPRFEKFFAPQNWLALTATLLVTKVIHELAHGVVCRRMGARCPEIGVILLCGTPCMYCDVTESWMLPGRLQRCAVMLAGVYVEAIMAALATFIWWACVPGPLYYACLNVMFVCGVSTLVFNLNPLMRFDGYYVLSDLWDMPNLRQQAQAAWRVMVVSRIGGFGYGAQSLRKPRHAIALATYHLLATLWRLLATVAIAFWILAIASSAHLHVLGYSLAAVLLFMSAVPYVRGLLVIMRGEGAWKGVVVMRRASILLAVVALVGLALAVPLPQRITALGTVDFADAQRVYVRTAGNVEQMLVDFGDRASAEQPLMRLGNVDLKHQMIKLTSQVAQERLNLAVLRQRSLSNPEMLQQWDSNNAQWQASLGRRTQVEQQLDELEIRSPVAGIVLAPSDLSGDPIDHLPDLVGRYLPVGTEICRIGDPEHLHVILEIDADKRRYIDMGSRASINCKQRPTVWIDSVVVAISPIHQAADPTPSLEEGQQRFRVLCKLPDASGLLVGSDAVAKLSAEPKALYQRIAAELGL